MNTRVLHVSGNDYAALDYEEATKNGKILPQELWEKSWDEQDNLPYRDDGLLFNYKAYKFGDVDPDFIKFVQDEINFRDTWEGNNFYII